MRRSFGRGVTVVANNDRFRTNLPDPCSFCKTYAKCNADIEVSDRYMYNDGTCWNFAPADIGLIRVWDGARVFSGYASHTLTHKAHVRYARFVIMVDAKDLIWIADAERDFNRSREWFLKQIKLGKLHKTRIEGDRKVYLLRSEIERLLQPRIIDF